MSYLDRIRLDISDFKKGEIIGCGTIVMYTKFNKRALEKYM